MAWECGECNAREAGDGAVKISAVCHHCGKPLCDGDRKQIIDGAFSAEYGPVGRAAYHCAPCRLRYHRPLATLMERYEE